MIKINKSYVYDENRKLIAVQIPIDEYKKLEEIIENHILAKFIDEDKSNEVLDLTDAKKFYNKLKKNADD